MGLDYRKLSIIICQLQISRLLITESAWHILIEVAIDPVIRWLSLEKRLG